MSTTMRVRNPVAESTEQHIEPADRIADLNGKTIGLYWNLKGGGEVALEHAKTLLADRFTDISFEFFHGTEGFVTKMLTNEQADQMAADCDAVIGTTSD